jgi:nitroreductase
LAENFLEKRKNNQMSNPVIDVLTNHRSIRKFKTDPIPEEILQTILNAATRAASAGNMQHYSFIVVDDPQKRKELVDQEIEGAAAIIAVVDEYRNQRWFEQNEVPFYFDQAVNFLIGFSDAMLALQNLVIAAESFSLGTVYIGTVLSMNLQKILGIPEHVFPAGMIWLGYPDETPALRPRLPLEAVVHRNGYHLPTDAEIGEFFKDKDALWNKIPEKRRKKLEELGIHNIAQNRTIGHYTEEFITSESQTILESLQAAGFKFKL